LNGVDDNNDGTNDDERPADEDLGEDPLRTADTGIRVDLAVEVPVEEGAVGVGRAEWSGWGLVSIDFRSKRPFIRTLFGIVLPDG
jgi:hypothetical protein